jgi:hypothetical protein
LKSTVWYIKVAALFCFVICLSGCSLQPSSKLNDAFIAQVNERLEDMQDVYDCAIQNKKPPIDRKKMICSGDSISDGSVQAQRIRNDAIDIIKQNIDRNYTTFIANLQNGHSTTEFVADLIDLATGAAIGVNQGKRSNQVLGVALTAFRGGRRSLNSNFFQNQAVPILINKMDDNRAKSYTLILKNKKIT